MRKCFYEPFSNTAYRIFSHLSFELMSSICVVVCIIDSIKLFDSITSMFGGTLS